MPGSRATCQPSDIVDRKRVRESKRQKRQSLVKTQTFKGNETKGGLDGVKFDRIPSRSLSLDTPFSNDVSAIITFGIIECGTWGLFTQPLMINRINWHESRCLECVCVCVFRCPKYAVFIMLMLTNIITFFIFFTLKWILIHKIFQSNTILASYN